MNSSRTTRRLAPLLLGAGLVAAAWRMPLVPAPRFVPVPVTPATQRAPLPPFFTGRMLPQVTPSAHACSLAVAPDGALLAAWFGGSSEGARDVAIQMVRLPEAALAPTTTDAPPADSPWVSLDRDRLQTLTSRVIRKIGNPVLWFDGAGRLHMLVVSVSYGGWSGSAVNQLSSDDEGHTWSEARRLVVSPFFNLSTLVRTQPQVLEDGTVGVPAYHELVQKWGLWLRVTGDGHVLASSPMQRYEGGWLQPAVAPLSSVDAVAALRSSARSHRVGWSATKDGGQSWPLRPAGSTVEVPNPDSSVAMIRLFDGTLLMACNPEASGRRRLQLYRSRDEGETWEASRLIEAGETGDEFSYPALVQDRQARIHLGYTWKRRGIRVCSFSPEWLDAADDGRPAAALLPAVVEQAVPSNPPDTPHASEVPATTAPAPEVRP